MLAQETVPGWKQYEGELAGGEYPLEQYLGGSEGSAVFLTRFASGQAAIKLVRAGQPQAGELVERWNRAANLRHAHLVRIFAAGTWAPAGTPLAYVVMEYAPENLAEVLRERPLTPDETREMLEPVAEALSYLHGQGLAHGDLKPSNIFAVEDQVKISSVAVSAGDPAADIRALGTSLVQVLSHQTSTTPQSSQDPTVEALPFPFRDIAQNCLQHDARLRWSAARILSWLHSPEPSASTLPPPAEPITRLAAEQSRRRYYLATGALVVVGAAIAVALVMHRTAAPVPPASGQVRSAPAPALSGPAAAAPASTPTAAPPVEREHESPGSRAAQDGIVRRVLPDIPAKARDTVHGKATVVVRVAVDPSGNVTQATLERGGSPYFGKLALEAARHWQFVPMESAGARNWILRFEIMRTATRVIPTKAAGE